MNLFQLGDFTLHSGERSRLKIECDALTHEDIQALAWIIKEQAGNFGEVEGVPRGGLPLAAELKQYITKGKLLIVDDVMTSGESMEEFRAGRDAIGAVVFARRETPDWVRPIFRMFASP